MSIIIQHISKSYTGNSIYRNFSLTLPEKRISCILGPSGCGKTTLLNILGGLTHQDTGSVRFDSDHVISYIFQDPRLLPWKTVKENIEFVLEKTNKHHHSVVPESYLQMVGLEAYQDYFPAQLSGGMKQRVAIARAFSYPSDIILMDEPLKTLDPKLKWSLMKTFLRIWKQDKRTVVFVTHDVDEALMLGEEIFIFSQPPVAVKSQITNPLTLEEKTPENKEFFEQKNKIMKLLD